MLHSVTNVFRTFEALAETCFLQTGFEYAAVYSRPDEFEDLKKLIQKYPHQKNSNHTKVDTLRDLLDSSDRFF